MTLALLTPSETLAHFNRRDRGSLTRLWQRGLVERVNVGGDTPQGRRYLYRLKPLEAEAAPVDEGEAMFMALKKAHGL